MSIQADQGVLAFAERLLGVLTDGRFSATYKYAVILGLVDLCLERSTQTGAAPKVVTTGELAEKVLEFYWPHTLPFRKESVLRQNSGRQASILTEITTFREKHAPEAGVNLQRVRAENPEQLQGLIRRIEWTLVEMPLPKLQRIGEEVHEFLYRIGWNDTITRSEFNDKNFTGRINFVGASGDYLARLAGLVRSLVQREWANRVARLNTDLVESAELDDFLFGADRVSLTPVRNELFKLQNGCCFYCDDRIRDAGEVDHFIPWARYPNNAIQNLVLAHKGCNLAKRDHLAAVEHVRRWVTRDPAPLVDIAARQTWESRHGRSLSVARSIYLRLPEDARLWQRDNEFGVGDRVSMVQVFGTE